MKLKTLFLGTAFIFSLNAFSQTWIPSGYTSGISYYNTSNTNIGIGAAPLTTDKLYVNGNLRVNGAIGCNTGSLMLTTNGTTRMKISSSGNVGIGDDPDSGYKLYVNGATLVQSFLSVTGGIHAVGNLWINGNVGIGMDACTNYKLTVDGSIRAEEVKIENITGCDFVFEDTYKRATLQEVEQYVKENKHLPGIASAAEMESNGVSVGELNMQLLQKVEELTLYMIDQNKKIETLEQELANLKK